MKLYKFKVTCSVTNEQGIVADSPEEAEEQLRKRNRSREDLEVELVATLDIEWFAEKCDSVQTGWYDDEFRYETSNHVELGPFDSPEEALNATRLKWGFTGNYSLDWAQDYRAEDVNIECMKVYRVYKKAKVPA